MPGGGGHGGGGHAGGGGGFGGGHAIGGVAGGGMPAAARAAGAIRSQGAFRGRAFPRASVNAISSPNRFVSTCGPNGCNDFGFRRRFFDNFVIYPSPFLYYDYSTWPYGIVPNYTVANQQTAFGTCQSVAGEGVVSNNCSPGLFAISDGNECACYSRQTGVSGCANVAGATCAPIVPSPYL